MVTARVVGASADTVTRMAIDTGAAISLGQRSLLEELGFSGANIVAQRRIVTVLGPEDLPVFQLERLDALGQTRRDFRILGHNLPPSSGIAGLLGLDFFRGTRLAIDFREGTIEVE